ncbi:PREDICTED: protein IQ-DOMAIN 32 [Erythranthe guttata]|uniref:protein IQ-DOMAIN 32 n=1 Tax=Erythranthe guttata TaxID=4155 RepID=UPI00064D9F30|nr:PREDICTED: protein IQ-DOMAIN 32 [Erythranthe guttata]|eukprot:XP_012835738.1 PREDICTED: protein IQ-DOMAIN 32 [Erythranthe guttata]
MGKSTASCFKIISCGSDSVDHDDLQTPESKGSGDRRGWSFRKKSPKHRVLSNSVTSEAPSSVNKENPESAAANVQAQPDLTVPEKNSVVQWADEKAELSAQVESKLAETIETVAPSKDDCGADATFDEPSVVTIQAAIRGLLAQQVLLKHKNIIKLQAAVRGHLVRRHAVGTLRCVQAIIKMQALVRERQARLNVEGSGDFVKQSESNGKDDKDSAFLNKKEAKPKGPYTYVSIDKLLSNAFARQLMESTPRSEPINIKCDPSKSDSAWQWLERWMSVSSPSNEGPEESASAVKHFDAKEDILVPSDCYSESRDFKFGEDAASIEASENDGTLIGHSELLHVIEQSNSKCDVTESAPAPFETKEAELVEVVEVISHPETEETVNEVETEQAETEVRKLSRKLSNPAFIAAQSKFEELGLAATSTKLPTSATHDPVVEESSLYKVSSSTDEPLISSKETPLAESAVSNPPPVQIGGSECGTELSISSTLDSPDRSEAAIVYDIEKEAKVPDETEHSKNEENLQFQTNGNSIVLETDPSYTNMNKLETYESTNSTFGESLDSITAADSPQLEKKKPEADPIETSHIAEEGSPRSHITVPDSQATPSSQVSVKTKKSKGGKTDSTSKRKNRATSSSADKSLANSDQDSASRNSLEHSQEQKTAKRRNSFGSAKLDNREEPRDSSSSNPLPSYMQATESARAKAIANGSPRSSPDVHDKDIYIKKRHSLPGSNERQGSPRIQRSLSQAQPNAKGNAATNSPQDRKWRR